MFLRSKAFWPDLSVLSLGLKEQRLKLRKCCPLTVTGYSVQRSYLLRVAVTEGRSGSCVNCSYVPWCSQMRTRPSLSRFWNQEATCSTAACSFPEIFLGCD